MTTSKLNSQSSLRDLFFIQGFWKVWPRSSCAYGILPYKYIPKLLILIAISIIGKPKRSIHDLILFGSFFAHELLRLLRLYWHQYVLVPWDLEINTRSCYTNNCNFEKKNVSVKILMDRCRNLSSLSVVAVR